MQIPEGRANEWGMATCPFATCTNADRDNPYLAWDPDNPENILMEALLDPLVRLGLSITVEGVNIELIQSGDADRVRISK